MNPVPLRARRRYSAGHGPRPGSWCCPGRAEPPARSIASASSRPPSAASRSRATATPGTSPSTCTRPAISTPSRSTSSPARPSVPQRTFRNPKFNFDQLPFPDTRITHYYDADPKVAGRSPRRFPASRSPRTWRRWSRRSMPSGWATPRATARTTSTWSPPAWRKGLPTFCDKPIGGTVAGTRKILEFARKHKAPLMSSSLFRHEWGMEAALRDARLRRVRRHRARLGPPAQPATAWTAG